MNHMTSPLNMSTTNLLILVFFYCPASPALTHTRLCERFKVSHMRRRGWQHDVICSISWWVVVRTDTWGSLLISMWIPICCCYYCRNHSTFHWKHACVCGSLEECRGGGVICTFLFCKSPLCCILMCVFRSLSYQTFLLDLLKVNLNY